jgi:hypothetical protein
MIELQLATGCRPGELCILRPGDVDRSGEVWEYVPQQHKTQHHEHDRVICIGPKGPIYASPKLTLWRFCCRESNAQSTMDRAEW